MLVCALAKDCSMSKGPLVLRLTKAPVAGLSAFLLDHPYSTPNTKHVQSYRDSSESEQTPNNIKTNSPEYVPVESDDYYSEDSLNAFDSELTVPKEPVSNAAEYTETSVENTLPQCELDDKSQNGNCQKEAVEGSRSEPIQNGSTDKPKPFPSKLLKDDIKIESEFTVEHNGESSSPNEIWEVGIKTELLQVEEKEDGKSGQVVPRKVVRNTARKSTTSVKRKVIQHVNAGDGKKSVIRRRVNANETNKNSRLKVHSGDKRLSCDTCSKRFSHISSLKVHQRTHAGATSKFSCSFCHKVFLHSSVLKVHLRIHTGERPYSCEKCPKKFRGAAQLTKHRSNHERVKKHVCPVCSKVFSSDAVLRRHNRVHTGEKPFSCEICYKRFSYEGDRKKHLRTHTKENAKKYPCPQCPKRFSDPFTVKSHMRYHTGENLHECTICHAKFPSPSHLKKHHQVHTGERPHRCFICLKSFSDSFVLKKHIRLHTGEKPFGCPMCDKRFNQQNHVTRHLKTHTSEDVDRYACSECGKTFSMPDNLKLHLRLHAADNPYKCKRCSKMFSSPSHLKRHMIVHSNLKPFTCEICEKAVTSSDVLKRHMELHTGKASYTCGVCLQKFKNADLVKAHLKTHHRGDQTETFKKRILETKCKYGRPVRATNVSRLDI